MIRSKIFVSVIVAVLLGVLPALADSVLEEWNSGSLNGWMANTLDNTVEWVSEGGVDNSGFLSSQSVLGLVGALQYSEPYIGDYGALGYVTVQCSLRFFTPGFTDVRFRVRYLDSSHNGWYIPLTEDFSTGEWRTVTKQFDPNWSDEDAMAAGWVQEPVSGTFAETMANVYTCGIRVLGVENLGMGIDNFLLTDELLATSPASWDKVKSLYR